MSRIHIQTEAWHVVRYRLPDGRAWEVHASDLPHVGESLQAQKYGAWYRVSKVIDEPSAPVVALLVLDDPCLGGLTPPKAPTGTPIYNAEQG